MKILKFFLCLLAVSPILAQTTTQPSTTTAKPSNTTVDIINDWISVLSAADRFFLEEFLIRDGFDATRDVSFVLYTQNNRNDGQNLSTTNLNSSNFNPSNPTRVITHGWLNVVTSPVNILLKDAYLKRGNFNVVCFGNNCC